MTVPTPAIAPFVPTYASYTPYITTADYINEPTGVDVTQLIPGNTDMTVQTAALARVIVRASAEADNLCQKTLAATVDVVAGRFRVRPDGTVHIPVEFTPVVMVTAVRFGPAANQLTSLADLSGLTWIGEKVVEVPIFSASSLAVPGQPLPAPGYAYGRPGWVYVELTYVNGWAHGALGSGVAAAAQSIVPASTLAYVPGLPLTIQDGVLSESIQVASWYQPGLANVPLVSPLLHAHSAGVTVSALPPVIRDATILLTTHKIKTRGAEAIVMGSAGGQGGRTQAIDPGGTTEYAEAKDLLAPFRRAA